MTNEAGTTRVSSAAPSLGTLDAFIEDAFGVPIGDIGLAVERAREESVATCMIANGWEYERIIPERFVPAAPGAIPETAAKAVRDGLSTPVDEETHVHEEPDEYKADLRMCSTVAEDDVPDPVTSAWAWLANETEDVYERVGSDSRVVAARAENEECLAATGFGSPEDVRNGFVVAAGDIGDAVLSGALDEETAFAELDELDAQEKQMWAATQPCIERMMGVEGTVAGEQEAAWLASEGHRLTNALAEMNDQLTALAEQLAQIESDG